MYKKWFLKDIHIMFATYNLNINCCQKQGKNFMINDYHIVVSNIKRCLYHVGNFIYMN